MSRLPYSLNLARSLQPDSRREMQSPSISAVATSDKAGSSPATRHLSVSSPSAQLRKGSPAHYVLRTQSTSMSTGTMEARGAAIRRSSQDVAAQQQQQQQQTSEIVQNQEKLHKATGEQLADIQKQLTDMHADFKKLETTTAAAIATVTTACGSIAPMAGGGTPLDRAKGASAHVCSNSMNASGNESWSPFVGTNVTNALASSLLKPSSLKTAPAPAGKVHHLSPITTIAPAPSQRQRLTPTPPPVKDEAKSAPHRHAAVAGVAGGSATTQPVRNSLVFDHVGILDSPTDTDSSDGDSVSDDESSASAIPMVGMTDKRMDGSPLTKKSAAKSSPGASDEEESAAGAAEGGAGLERDSADNFQRQGIGFKRFGDSSAIGTVDIPKPPRIRGVQMTAEAEATLKETSLLSLSMGGRSKNLFVGDVSADSDRAHAVDGQDQATRRKSQAARNMRNAFFRRVPRLSEMGGNSKLRDPQFCHEVLDKAAPCSWLACAALAISYVTGVPTPIEKILRTNHLGVHYISLSAITLAQFSDLINDYLHARFCTDECAEDEVDEDVEAALLLSAEQLEKLRHVHSEMATFDADVVDPLDAEKHLGMGEHVPISSLAAFRKELVEHANDENALYVFNYDPYIIEEREAHLKSNMAETEEEAAAIMESMVYKPGSKGSFGIIMDFNPVTHAVTIATPHLTSKDTSFPPTEQNFLSDDEKSITDHPRSLAARRLSASTQNVFNSLFSNIVFEERVVPMQTLYEAAQLKDNYTKLSRGFVRVFINELFPKKVPSIFPLFVLDGSSSAGLMTNVLHVTIAPHILGLAMMHHLTVTFLMSDGARRKQSSRNLLSKANVCDVKLRGIPLTKICQQLRLPLSTIVGDSNRASLPTVYVWYHVFLQQLMVSREVRLGLVQPERRGGAEDGMPNISEEEFIAHLRLATETKSVMLISFNVNIALNVRIDNRDEPAHFAIVIGLDEERGVVRLADVNVRRFRKTWHIPILRLYNAVMGYGYMMSAREKKTVKALSGKVFQQRALLSAKYFLPPPTNVISRFEYPAQPYVVTVLADAVERLGFRADVERFMNFSGFHISYFLSCHMVLQTAANVTQNYSHYALDDALSVKTTYYDYWEGNLPPNEADPANPVNPRHKLRTEEDLLADVLDALAHSQDRKLIVKYDKDVIMAEPSVWNGSTSGGNYALVVDYNEHTNVVILMDCDPSQFHRIFACPLPLLIRALRSYDREGLRANGTLCISKEPQEIIHDNSKGYDMAHALVHHPFMPMFSPTCSCLALAATEMMQNIDTPALLGGAPVASVGEDEKKKYKRYNNIFSAEDFLYALPSFSVQDWHRMPLSDAISVQTMNRAFEALKLPLKLKVVATEGDAALKNTINFCEACNGVSGLFSITLVLYDTDLIHGVPGVSVGVVNRVEVDEEEDGTVTGCGSVQLIEGDLCRWGTFVERSAEELMAATKGIFCVCEVDEDELGAGASGGGSPHQSRHLGSPRDEDEDDAECFEDRSVEDPSTDYASE